LEPQSVRMTRGRQITFLLLVLLLGFSHRTVETADVDFDDSYAWSLCGGKSAPDNPTIVALCSEMMSVGQWYTSEVERMGVKNGVEQIKPTHLLYKDVRKLGLEVDLRAQELMVLMARVKCHDPKGGEEEKTASCAKLKELETDLEMMCVNAANVDLVDAITAGAESSAHEMAKAAGGTENSPDTPERKLRAYDAEALLAQSKKLGIPLAELISRKRKRDLFRTSTRKRKPKKKGKRKNKDGDSGNSGESKRNAEDEDREGAGDL
jgi:hypothetical protein